MNINIKRKCGGVNDEKGGDDDGGNANTRSNRAHLYNNLC